MTKDQRLIPFSNNMFINSSRKHIMYVQYRQLFIIQLNLLVVLIHQVVAIAVQQFPIFVQVVHHYITLILPSFITISSPGLSQEPDPSFWITSLYFTSRGEQNFWLLVKTVGFTSYFRVSIRLRSSIICWSISANCWELLPLPPRSWESLSQTLRHSKVIFYLSSESQREQLLFFRISNVLVYILLSVKSNSVFLANPSLTSALTLSIYWYKVFLIFPMLISHSFLRFLAISSERGSEVELLFKLQSVKDVPYFAALRSLSCPSCQQRTWSIFRNFVLISFMKVSMSLEFSL